MAIQELVMKGIEEMEYKGNRGEIGEGRERGNSIAIEEIRKEQAEGWEDPAKDSRWKRRRYRCQVAFVTITIRYYNYCY